MVPTLFQQAPPSLRIMRPLLSLKSTEGATVSSPYRGALHH
jgi:hypothetical protein